MDIYHYHPLTGEYLGPGTADPDPLENEVNPDEGPHWLIPAYATTVAPPETVTDGHVRTFNSLAEVWEEKQDCRGQLWYDGEGNQILVSQLGNPASHGWTQEAPPPAPEPPRVPTPRLMATALLTVAGGEIGGVGSAAGFSFGLPLGPGLYWLFFAEEMPDLNYAYTVASSEGRVCVTDRQTSYMELTVTDPSGEPIDPRELSIQLYRAD